MADVALYGSDFEVLLEDTPFAVGTERYAYRGELLQAPCLHPIGKKVVVKTFKKDYEPGTYGDVFSKINIDTALRIARLAQSYVQTFNTTIQPPQRLEVLWPMVVKVTSVPGKEPPVKTDFVIAEAFLNGEFVKFNSNTGWENYKYTDSAVLAFSHYTWVKSKGKILICDLQGTEENNKVLLTDIVIMSASESFQFGYTDMGMNYIQRFIERHQCNQHCKKFLAENCQG